MYIFYAFIKIRKHLGQDVAAVLVLANDQRWGRVVCSDVGPQRVDGRDLPFESWDVKEKGKCTSPWDPKP